MGWGRRVGVGRLLAVAELAAVAPSRVGLGFGELVADCSEFVRLSGDAGVRGGELAGCSVEPCVGFGCADVGAFSAFTLGDVIGASFIESSPVLGCFGGELVDLLAVFGFCSIECSAGGLGV